MRAFFQSWLNQQGAKPGVLLGGVFLPNHTCLGCSGSADFPEEKVEEVMRHLQEYSASLLQHRLGATRMLWTFEKAQLHWTARADKVSLVLLTTTNTTICEPSEIEAVLGEFLALQV